MRILQNEVDGRTELCVKIAEFSLKNSKDGKSSPQRLCGRYRVVTSGLRRRRRTDSHRPSV